MQLQENEINIQTGGLNRTSPGSNVATILGANYEIIAYITLLHLPQNADCNTL